MPKNPARSGRLLRVVALLSVVSLSVAGCWGSDGDAEAGDEQSTGPSSGQPSGQADDFDEGAVAAEPAGNVEAGGCDIPITFDIAEDWAVESVSADTAETFEQGGFLPGCEVSGHGAGWIGFIRVWVGPDSDAEHALETFIADTPGELRDTDTREITIADTQAHETAYIRVDGAGDLNPGRAFALPHADGTVVVEVSGLDEEEYAGMLPAYILARTSTELA